MGSSNNGSAATVALAQALKSVVSEAVQEQIAPLQKDVTGIKGDVESLRTDLKQKFDHLEGKIDTTNKNMYAQFATVHKDIGLLKKQLGS